MQLTEQHINKLKEYGIITSTLPASVIIDQLQLNTVDLNKIWKYINLIEPTSNIEDWLNEGPTPPGPTPTNDYLTFDVLTDGKIYWSLIIDAENYEYDPNDYKKTISYSKDNGETWTEITSSLTASTYIEVSTGDKVKFKGNNSWYGTIFIGEGEEEEFLMSMCTFSPVSEDEQVLAGCANFNVSGNIMSLIGGDNFEDLTTFTDSYALMGLFNFCLNIIDASELLLPATTLTTGCYYAMFSNCVALTAAPELPAETLTEWCYNCMFENCTSLTTAPDLLASTLPAGCYNSMFKDCSNLNYIKCLATSKENNSTYFWVSGVANNGTFVKDASMSDWTTIEGYDNGIPSGWTVEDAA